MPQNEQAFEKSGHPAGQGKPGTFRLSEFLLAGSLLLLPLAAPAQNQQLQFHFGKTQRIPAEGLSEIYDPETGKFAGGPAVITVTSAPGTITHLAVSSLYLNHEFPEDLDILLVGPAGQSVILMSDAGAGTPLNYQTLTFDDDAASPVPETGLADVRYRPTDYEPGDTFPAPAPSGPYGTALSVFNGTSPVGDWKLFVLDDTRHPDEVDLPPGGGASILGWTLEMVTTESDQVLPPANDSFARRISLEGLMGSVSVPSTGVRPTREPGEPLLAEGSPDDAWSLWFSWTAPRSGHLLLRPGDSSYLPLFALYRGNTLDSLERIAGFGDFPVEEGTTYQIRADANLEPRFGNLVLDWDLRGSTLGPAHIAYIRSDGTGYQLLGYTEGTDYITVSPYETTDSTASLGTGPLWASIFLYDYSAERFTEAMYDQEVGLSAIGGGRRPSENGEAGGSGAAVMAWPKPNRPGGVHFREEQTATVSVHAPGAGYQEAIYNFSTHALRVSPYRTESGETGFRLPFNEWIGVFHFDYVAGRFTELDLRLKTED